MPGTTLLIRMFAVTMALGCATMPASGKDASGFSRLSWLAGCWDSASKDFERTEQWMQPRGGTMLGIGRTVAAGKTTHFEFMRIHEAPDGTLLFTAIPSGKSEATFTQLRLSESEIVFENPTHDFPQRVIYRRDGEARIVGSIEGTTEGAVQKFDFPLRRAKCDR